MFSTSFYLRFRGVVTWILCVIVAAICASSANSISSQRIFECAGEGPVATLDLIPDTNNPGKTSSIKLPRSYSHLNDKPTDVEFSLAWDLPQAGVTQVTATFFYNAQYSLEYPVYRVQFFFMDGERVLTEESFDYTQACSNAYGYPLFAGSTLDSASISVDLSKAKQPHIRALVWGGNF